ncbi:MAG: helix-turn-helix transcriptional regulator [Ignavibacteriae bacterium]|nr:helix-turn-helix transcriptional regulator [Ignavibacteria bacterium]MBI3365108.1 helix-turn-helix transcriptional regulator [Ignavibacteriota bacterium]
MKSMLSSRIRVARENKELDQGTLSKKVDVATRTLQRWEKGNQVPDSNYLMRLAKFTGVRPEWLLTGEGEMYLSQPSRSNIIPFQKDQLLKNVVLVDIPVLSSVPAGKTNAMFYPDYAERYVTVDNIKDRDAFALVVKGNSMSPRIENGDIVVISPREEVRNGDICVVRVNEEDVLKKIKIDEHHIHLIPLNPNFEPLTVRKRDVTFIWKVVKVVKNL